MQHRQSKQTSQISIVSVDEDTARATGSGGEARSSEPIGGSDFQAPALPRIRGKRERIRGFGPSRCDEPKRILGRGVRPHTSSKGEGKDDRRMRNIIAVRDSAGNVPFSIAPSLPPSTTGGER